MMTGGRGELIFHYYLCLWRRVSSEGVQVSKSLQGGAFLPSYSGVARGMEVGGRSLTNIQGGGCILGGWEGVFSYKHKGGRGILSETYERKRSFTNTVGGVLLQT